MPDPGNGHTLSEEEINAYSKELDELFQSLISQVEDSPESTEE
jgi:hypothetical protein